MRINVAVPEARVSKPILDATLEGVTRLNEALLEEGDVPLFRSAVNHVRWKPEPPGEEHFDHAAKVLGRGWGDCDDLAPWHAASLRVTGEDPDAEAVVRRSGKHKWHAVVQRGDGSIDDPSREAGMGQRRNGVNGAALPLMVRSASVVGAYDVQRPQLALRPIRDSGGLIEAWEARADLPWHYSPGNSPLDVAMASLHRSPVSSQAVVGACLGALELGEESELIGDDVLDRVSAIADACEGCGWEDLADEYGEEIADETGEIVGGFFKSLGKGLKGIGKGIVKVATSKMGRGLISMIPGAGPVAATALDMASPALNKLVSSGRHKRRVKSAPKAARVVVPKAIVRRKRKSRASSSLIKAPTAQQCVKVLAKQYGVDGEFVGWAEVGRRSRRRRRKGKRRKFRFGKFLKGALLPHTLIKNKGLKRVLMPHTMITDKSKALRRIVEPHTAITERKRRPKRRRRRRSGRKKFTFGKFMKGALLPHTLIKNKAMKRVLMPHTFITDKNKALRNVIEPHTMFDRRKRGR